MGTLLCDFCSAENPPWQFDVPAFVVDIAPAKPFTSAGALATCRACRGLVEAQAEEALFQRALGHYTVAAAMAQIPPVLAQDALRALHARFWAEYRKAGAPTARMTTARRIWLAEAFSTALAKLKANDVSVRELVRRSGKTDAEWLALLKLTDDELMAFVEREGEDLIAVVEAMAAEAPRPDPLLVERPWMAALEAQWSAVATLDLLAKALKAHDCKAPTGGVWMEDSASPVINPAHGKNDLAINWERDAQVLRIAETYAWYGDALQAVRQAAQSVPDDVPLSKDMIPGTGHGFWWFTPPLEGIATTVHHAQVDGLLWSLANRGESGRPSHVVFSAYVRDTVAGTMRPVPTTMFRWSFGQTQAEMVQAMTTAYEQAYGPGGIWEKQAPRTFGKGPTLAAVQALAGFFMAGCAWLQQEILHVVEGGVQRHRRRQLQREYRLAQPVGAVKVIALRRSHYEHADAPAVTAAPETADTRTYTCQWVVRGHWRNVACGPARTERRLRFIHPYIAGPDGLPLRTQRKVFAVVR